MKNDCKNYLKIATISRVEIKKQSNVKKNDCKKNAQNKYSELSDEEIDIKRTI